MCPAQKVRQALKVHQVPKDLRVILDRKDHRDLSALKDPKDFLAMTELRGMTAFLAPKVNRVLKEFRVRKVHKDLPVRMGLTAFKVLRAPLVPKALRVILVLKD